MIIDSFLFFQELDLLEIRLNYLYEYVDKFVIIEACQTFKGKRKKFNFENHKNRFKKYSKKIIYYKINDFHHTFEELYRYLSNHKYSQKRFISKLIESHYHYDRKHLWWVLESYHRECIHLVLKKICHSNDIVILSDLDEIPSLKVFDFIKKNKKLSIPLVCEQYEFKYYLNSLNNLKWLGSMISPYSFLEKKSLNLMRKESSKFKKIKNAGYHFTSLGGEKLLKSKIESWGHQEFNIDEIKNNLKHNLLTGRDVFYRLGISRNKIIDIEKDKIFDMKIKKILSNYNQLQIKTTIKENLFDVIFYRYIQLKIYISLVKKNPLRAIFKLKNIFSKNLSKFF
ncbi:MULTISPECIES: hypothetical protein [Prochlorococcus]|uniref:hypothetical protein n=1 Tax=Prochlorococcus TaxID=1218 RepID=UPI0005162096|nr:hypothetical protein [Prochlorococcus marinus]